ncbi:hypothetical protein DPMN_108355 [Dreissena polymorpha]|uniref:Uncharacterized protein n=1 Tax=Dreissena polymorpha TaxID=45954 RepID=A0A9D4K8X6_DREPO|nr:hypothetical protein DPMN_108355 [Dreissena polymorpha]
MENHHQEFCDPLVVDPATSLVPSQHPSSNPDRKGEGNNSSSPPQTPHRMHNRNTRKTNQRAECSTTLSLVKSTLLTMGSSRELGAETNPEKKKEEETDPEEEKNDTQNVANSTPAGDAVKPASNPTSDFVKVRQPPGGKSSGLW